MTPAAFESPIEEFVQRAAAAQTPHRCQIFGSLEALRWALDEPVLHALAAKFWAAGVDGTPLPLAIKHQQLVADSWPRHYLLLACCRLSALPAIAHP